MNPSRPFIARHRDAFSLIEVVLALAIISFALIAILGLFSAGLKVNKESADQIQAAHIASLLISARRADPTGGTNSALAEFALPTLIEGSSKQVKVGLDGTTNNPVMNLIYTVTINDADSNIANVYLLLWAPIGAANPPTNNPGSYYEISTQVKLQ